MSSPRAPRLRTLRPRRLAKRAPSLDDDGKILIMSKIGKEQEVGRTLAEAVRHPRYEVIPLGGVEEAIVEHVPKSIKLTVTASPKKGIEETLRLAERLAERGYEVAPHISARLVRDEAHLEDVLGRLREAGIKDVFVIAGDADEPAGKFEDAAALLRTMAEIGHDFEEVGISGYPESHPLISDETTIQAMYDKAPYATYIVSQICFDPAVTARWIRRVRNRGVELPIYIGIPGVVNTTKLMRISGSIGLGESARFLKKYGSRFFRMLLPGRYSPDRLIKGLTPSLADPQCKVHGFHIYTFNEVGKTEAWRRRELNNKGAA
jgi:methylenetetrahydrofolate reductase (NADPH)